MIILGIFGGQEIILILVLVLLFTGGKHIPEIMRFMGKNMSNFSKTKEIINNPLDSIKKKLGSDNPLDFDIK